MMPRAFRLADVQEALLPSGLLTRGGFNLAPGEDVRAGYPAKAVVLVGNAGGAFWSHFQAWLTTQPADLADPLDTWSQQVLEAAAATCGALVVMPNDKPFAPFQQWAMRAERLKPSPLGILMHAEYGLWHAYRGALLLDGPLAAEDLIQDPKNAIHLCDLCIEKPCLNACPVGAFGEGFDHLACHSHITGSGGQACLEGGCLARNACPHDSWSYPVPMQAFLMRAFRGPMAGGD